VKKVVHLSVVIIARNEEDSIADAICSTMRAASHASRLLNSYEIILADSDSSDRTVQIASKFPITILKLSKPYIGASAGRYIGYKNATGDYLLFLDGDTILYENFVLKAIKYMEQKPEVAGVSGYFTFSSTKNDPNMSHTYMYKRLRMANQHAPIVKYLPGGAAIYRKAVLDKVRSFNPWILGEEERDLGFHIRQKNFELHLLDIPAIHKIRQNNMMLTHRIRYYQGVGQLLRIYCKTPLALELLKRYWFHLCLLGWVVLIIPTAFLSFFRLLHPSIWKAIAITSISAYGIVAWVKGGILAATRSLTIKLLQSFGILIGLTKTKRNIATFPSAKLLKKVYRQKIVHESTIHKLTDP